MGKLINHTKLSETLGLSECTDGFWLWDETRQMNLSMKAETSTDAFVEALHYYQGRLTEVERLHTDMSLKVHAFVSQFADDHEDDE